MQTECEPLSEFEHGTIKARPGVSIWVGEYAALDLERAGLVRIKQARPAANKMMPSAENKGPNSPAAGVAAPSSASPAAPLSPKRTVIGLKRPASETKDYE